MEKNYQDTTNVKVFTPIKNYPAILERYQNTLNNLKMEILSDELPINKCIDKYYLNAKEVWDKLDELKYINIPYHNNIRIQSKAYIENQPYYQTKKQFFEDSAYFSQQFYLDKINSI